MIYRIIQVLLILCTINMISCNGAKQKNSPMNLSQDEVTAKLLEANKALIEFENEQIDKLISSNGWNMIETPTGLRYERLETGNSLKSVAGQLVTIEYEVKLITNEVIYSSVKNGPKVFRIGSGGVESGLEEGILLLGMGDKARFIIPSYLAHGLSGDQDQIPAKATLIYTVKVINLK